MKTQYELDEFDTSKKHVVKILVYAVLLSLLVSRVLLDLTEHADEDIVFPPECWAATFRSHAQLLLHRLGEFFGYSPPPLLDWLIAEGQKVHQERQILQKELATVTQPTAEV